LLKKAKPAEPENIGIDEARESSGDFLSGGTCRRRKSAARAKVIEEFIDEFARDSA
jgi:hypothetical protein